MLKLTGALLCLGVTAAASHGQVHPAWPPVGLQQLPARSFLLADDSRNALWLDDEFVFDGVAEDGSLAFFSARDLDILPDGRLVIADPEGNRIAVLSPTGSLLAHAGRAGEGPGEFADRGPRFVAATATYIAAGSIERGPLVVFRSSDYSFHGTIALPDGALLQHMASVGVDSVVMAVSVGASEHTLIVLVDLTTGVSTEVLRISSRPVAVFTPITRGGHRGARLPVPVVGAQVKLAAGSDYFAVADPLDYAVAAFDAAGSFLWGVQVADQRAEISRSDEREIDGPIRQMDDRRGTRWADSLRFLETKHPAIRRLQIDGEGRLFVFRTPGSDSQFLPVDVYGRTGDLLATVAMRKSEYPGWAAADGTAVYTLQAAAEDNAVIAVGRLILQIPR